MISFNNIKLSKKGELYFFYLLTAIHFIILFFFLFDLYFIIFFIYELFFFFTRKQSFKIIAKVVSFTLVIFLTNLFFADGKILFTYKFLKITHEGLYQGIQKSGFFFLLFLFTNNSFNEFKDKIIFVNNSKSTIIYNSLLYFFSFLELFNKNNKQKLFRFLYRIYIKGGHPQVEVDKNFKIINKKIIIYHTAAFVTFIIILILKKMIIA